MEVALVGGGGAPPPPPPDPPDGGGCGGGCGGRGDGGSGSRKKATRQNNLGKRKAELLQLFKDHPLQVKMSEEDPVHNATCNVCAVEVSLGAAPYASTLLIRHLIGPRHVAKLQKVNEERASNQEAPVPPFQEPSPSGGKSMSKLFSPSAPVGHGPTMFTRLGSHSWEDGSFFTGGGASGGQGAAPMQLEDNSPGETAPFLGGGLGWGLGKMASLENLFRGEEV